MATTYAKKIDEGLKHSRFGLVIWSPAFFRKQWIQYELDGLITKQMTGEPTILPIWHRLTQDEIAQYSPSLAGIVSLSSSTLTIEQIAQKVAEKIKDHTTSRPSHLLSTAAPATRQPSFGVFYAAPAGMAEPQKGKIPWRQAILASETEWLSMVDGNEELEYIIEDNILRVRLDWGNRLSGDEFQAQSLINSTKPFALTIRSANDTQRYFPAVRNTSPTRLGQGNRSGWMVFQILTHSSAE